MTENMDTEQRNDFDAKLSGEYEDNSRIERRLLAAQLGG